MVDRWVCEDLHIFVVELVAKYIWLPRMTVAYWLVESNSGNGRWQDVESEDPYSEHRSRLLELFSKYRNYEYNFATYSGVLCQQNLTRLSLVCNLYFSFFCFVKYMTLIKCI